MSFNSAGSNFSSNDHFSSNPLNVSLPRSSFDRKSSTKTTIKVGKLTPFYLDEVLPGDTFEIDCNFLARGVTPLYPTMDNAVIDTFFFFVPHRLVWKDWEKFNGFSEDPWYQEQEFLIPSLRDVKLKYASGNLGAERLSYSKPIDLASYLGVPATQFTTQLTGSFVAGLLPDISTLPFRSYAKIWNDWFRDQNTQGTIIYSMGDNSGSQLTVTNADANNTIERIYQAAFVDNQLIETHVQKTNLRYYDYWYETIQYGIGLAPVNKLSDYFTSALPKPQKGDPVTLPIGISGIANLKFRSGETVSISTDKLAGKAQVFNMAGSPQQLNPKLRTFAFGDFGSRYKDNGPRWANMSPEVLYAGKDYDFEVQGNSSNPSYSISGYVNGSDLTGVSVNINELRQAIALQQALEKDARGGTRYIEVIRSHFGVISPDARLQRSEYLGGSRTYIRNNQVLQTSSTSTTSPLGQTGAYSLTTDRAGFVKSFTEHGYIIGLTCVRVEQSYSQGIRRLWTRKRRFDFYWPVFNNIGEQPIYTKELFVNQVSDYNSDNVFGYQEAWADYRYKNNLLTGFMKPQTFNYRNANPATKSAASVYRWTYTTYFNTAPLLSNQFQQENPDQFSQTLAITASGFFDFIADFFISNKTTRVMSTYSVPGLERM